MVDIWATVKGFEHDIVSWRRQIHATPELGGEEIETSALVAKLLRQWGLEAIEGVAGTGVVAILRGEQAGHCVALRADMDALPVAENTGLPFASKIPGRMHACGHDGHTAMLLGAAKVLSTMRKSLKGTVKFFFQHAEECAPHGGAKGMVEAGVMEDPAVDFVFALHLWPEIPFGKIGVKSGPLMSASDRLHIEIHGKGGHGAAPHQAVDAVVVASQVVNALQTIVSRQVDPLDSVVVTIGKLAAGQRYNVIAPTAQMDGTVRTQNEAIRRCLPAQITRLVKSVAAAFGATAEVNYEFGYPTLINHEDGVDIIVRAAQDVFGPDSTITLDRPSMGGEDFAHFLHQASGAMFWLGCRGINTPNYPLHNAQFDFDESVLARGTAVMVRAVTLALGRDSNA
jgi:amidohydrolase